MTGPIGGTEGMTKLTPKGSKLEKAVPLGRFGDGSEYDIRFAWYDMASDDQSCTCR